MMRRANRITHPLNVSYLVVGLVFLSISGSWALRSAGLVDTRQFGWILPLMLVVVGAVGLAASTVKGARRRRHGESDDAADADRLDDSDPIPTYSFGIDDLEEKLERAARADTASTLPDQPVQPVQPVEHPGDRPDRPGGRPADAG